MRQAALAGAVLLVAMAGAGLAEQGFDEKYQRDFNIFNPINQYQPTNRSSHQRLRTGDPVNPINRFDPDNPPIRSTNTTSTISSIT